MNLESYVDSNVARVTAGKLVVGRVVLFFLSTRLYRRARNKLIIGLGYFVIGLSSLLPLFVFVGSMERMGIRHDTPQGDTALVAYTMGFVSVAALTFSIEFKWRKSVGLWGKKSVPRQEKRD